MSPHTAAGILALSPDATPEQIEAKFRELRAKLEDKIAKAPTPGLKEKYRESLSEILTAFETLTLAADSSALPVLRKQEATGAKLNAPEVPEGGVTPPRGASVSRPGMTHPKKSGSGKEFAIVAVIALVILTGGGWFIMKTRTENSEKARLAAEAKIEAERQAEAKKLTEQQEKQRMAAEAAAEKVRQESLVAQLRATQAEQKIRWETLQQELAGAERRLSELKSDSRNTRDLDKGQVAELQAQFSAQGGYVEWLQGYLARHVARTQLAKLDALLSARALDDARQLSTELTDSLTAAEQELVTQRDSRLALSARVEISSLPDGLPYAYTDAYGNSREGKTPAKLNLPLGALQVRIQRGGAWPDFMQQYRVKRGEPLKINAEFPSGSAWVESVPAGADVIVDGLVVGRTPLLVSELFPGPAEIGLQLKDYTPVTLRGTVLAKQELRLVATLEKYPAPVLGEPYTVSELNLKMQPIAPGTFIMGSPSDFSFHREIQTRVTLTRAYWLGATEVTQSQYEEIMGKNPNAEYYKGSYVTAFGANFPVSIIAWNDALEFCRRLTQRERLGGRLPEGYVYTLPTEAQWEYAARAGDSSESPQNIYDVAWVGKLTGGEPKPVAQKPANAWGLYDMMGNVAEWCLDYTKIYTGGYVTDPRGLISGSVVQPHGGGYSSVNDGLKYGHRGMQMKREEVVTYKDGIGFRVALAPAR